MFREAVDSPVPKADLDRFVPLAYYPIDATYRTPAALAPLSDAESPAFEMPTSTGQRRQMRKAGKLKFTLHGQTYTLTAFVTAEDAARRRLFVPFRDLTAGLETYAVGPLPRSRSHAHGALRPRFQHRVPAVLLLRRQVRLPHPARRRTA